jgi:hypothetical protein
MQRLAKKLKVKDDAGSLGDLTNPETIKKWGPNAEGRIEKPFGK